MPSFLNNDIGGYSYLGDTSQNGFEAGFSPGVKTPNTNITWGNLLGALSSSSPTQQQSAVIPQALPSVTQQGSVPVYNTPQSLPTQQKKKDSTGEVISLLVKFFGL